jgi:hypothetical protein
MTTTTTTMMPCCNWAIGLEQSRPNDGGSWRHEKLPNYHRPVCIIILLLYHHHPPPRILLLQIRWPLHHGPPPPTHPSSACVSFVSASMKIRMNCGSCHCVNMSFTGLVSMHGCCNKMPVHPVAIPLRRIPPFVGMYRNKKTRERQMAVPCCPQPTHTCQSQRIL